MTNAQVVKTQTGSQMKEVRAALHETKALTSQMKGMRAALHVTKAQN